VIQEKGIAMNAKPNMARQLVISLVILGTFVLIAFTLTRHGKSDEATAAPAQSNATVEVSPVGQNVVQILTAPVRTGTLSRDIEATGLVSYPADQTVKISPRLQGRVREVLVKVGDHVTAGQTLAIMDSVDAANAQTTMAQNDNRLRLAKITLERNQRLYRLGTPEVTQAQATLEQAQAATLAAKEVLDRTTQQSNIGGFTEPPLETAQNAYIAAKQALVQAQSDLALAEKDRARKEELIKIGVIATQDVEASQNVLEKARVAVQSDQDSLKLAQQAYTREQKAYGTKLYSEQQVRAATAAYKQAQLQEEAAKTALTLARAAILSNLQQAQSDYQAALTDSENAHRVFNLLDHPAADGTVRILAPISGVVTDRQVSPGQVVDQSQMTPWQMFVISNTAIVWVDADIYEKDIASITPGLPVKMHVAALPGRVFSGRVLRIAPTLDRTVRAVKVRSEIDNSSGLIRDGMFADVTISRPRGQQITIVPLEAIQHTGEEDFVYIAEGKKYTRRKVKLGPQRDGMSVVLEGLKPGEVVVTHGAIFLGEQSNNG
jgi:membrane fusion protein, heavy metal efflux system